MHFTSLRRAVVAPLTATVLVGTAALAFAAGTSPKTGYYETSKTSHRTVNFSVVKKGKALEVENFGLNCFTNDNDIGALYIPESKHVKVSKSGTFSYKGKATHFHNGGLDGTGTLKVSGKFISSTKVTGTASYTATPKLTGCPSGSFKAKRTKS